MRVYPQTLYDEGGIKFVFDNKGYHYIIRFAGNPMFLLEKQYELYGGTNFKEIYRKAKLVGRANNLDNSEDLNNVSILMRAKNTVESFLSLLETINKDGHPPLVIYFNPSQKK